MGMSSYYVMSYLSNALPLRVGLFAPSFIFNFLAFGSVSIVMYVELRYVLFSPLGWSQKNSTQVM